MAIEIKAPRFPESIADGTVAAWHKQPGDAVRRDDLLVDIETDKVVLEIVAPVDGTLGEILKSEGEIVLSEELIALFEAGVVEAAASSGDRPERAADISPGAPEPVASPAARKLANENGLDLASLNGSGKGGRITKEDVARAVAGTSPEPGKQVEVVASATAVSASPGLPSGTEERVERRVPMTRLRASIARRLVEAQHNAAMLTTFNEVNMQPVMALRSKYREEFERRHNGTRLGYMSFFVRVTVEALKRFPSVNASIDGNDVLYHGFYDIGVAITTERGLVVPVVRDADGLSLAQIEDAIRDYGSKARDGKLSIEDMSGGTFTISNGGVFGSLLSTPILNPPQTGILGMHKIEERPVVEAGEIVVRPMMYLALSYDHRLIDGQEAVRFLVDIKALLEDPARILLDI
ncbi:MAG: 2-oxoglutarate dehydrogenase complex dihydrolipoyllysine-residue succinyltransferase [Gammaproteobacteria bacterium]|nr:MAG: 2-oxoglutarate dehydrogenase complex dihydrolipoyllysine-residue succinyltransferase [Gammaproteobacteria bacterium]